MLNVQTFLLSHTLNDLIREHGVYPRFSKKNPRKFSLNYDQLEAKDVDLIAQESRGLVLSTLAPLNGDLDVVVGLTNVLALPMHRFFNHGQGACAAVDMDNSNTRFYEKLDGTCCIVYFDYQLQDWCVATRSVPDADLPMDGFGDQTFSDLFWKAFAATGGNRLVLDEPVIKGHTFCFELCTPENQIVVKYDDYKVYLLAVRDTMVGNEYQPDEHARLLNVPVAPYYKLGSLQEVMDFVCSRDPSKHEGVVVCDNLFRRCKIKNAGYMALGKFKDSVAKSPRAMMEVVLLGKEDDVLPLLVPAHQELILSMREGVAAKLKVWDELYSKIYHPDRKTFALTVQATDGAHMPYMMTRWQGHCENAKDWIYKARKGTTWNDGFLDMLISSCKL